MDFLIVDLISEDLAVSWLTNHFHPDGLKCPHCGTDVRKAREFRQTTMSKPKRMRCSKTRGKKGTPHQNPADPHSNNFS